MCAPRSDQPHCKEQQQQQHYQTNMLTIYSIVRPSATCTKEQQRRAWPLYRATRYTGNGSIYLSIAEAASIQSGPSPNPTPVPTAFRSGRVADYYILLLTFIRFSSPGVGSLFFFQPTVQGTIRIVHYVMRLAVSGETLSARNEKDPSSIWRRLVGRKHRAAKGDAWWPTGWGNDIIDTRNSPIKVSISRFYCFFTIYSVFSSFCWLFI